MRLGDLDALKEDLGKSTVTIIGYGKAVFLDKAYEVIDNAPTVEPFDYIVAERAKARQRGYEDGYRTGMGIGKTLNPKIKQGEWIIHNKGEHNEWHECPFCNNHKKYYARFCDYCGADMRGVESHLDDTSTVAINKDFYKKDKSNPINRSDLFQ